MAEIDATVSQEDELCECNEPTCSGCKCGVDCSFAPGHEYGTKAIEPLAALIEAVERLIEDAERCGDTIDTEGFVSDEYRRLYATLAYAKAQRQ